MEKTFIKDCGVKPSYANHYMSFAITTKDENVVCTNEFKLIDGKLRFIDSATGLGEEILLDDVSDIVGNVVVYWEDEGKKSHLNSIWVETVYENGVWKGLFI